MGGVGQGGRAFLIIVYSDMCSESQPRIMQQESMTLIHYLLITFHLTLHTEYHRVR